MTMPAESTSHLLTAEELELVEMPGKSTELVRGHLVVSEPPGARHGSISARLTYLLGSHVYASELGILFAQDTGFKLESHPDTVRAPDVAFVSYPRAGQIPGRGYAPFAPDLAVEILSPNDRFGELLAKIGQLLTAGTRLVWVINPSRAQAVVYRANGDVEIIGRDGVLDGEDVLPGFHCTIAEVLA